MVIERAKKRFNPNVKLLMLRSERLCIATTMGEHSVFHMLYYAPCQGFNRILVCGPKFVNCSEVEDNDRNF